MRDRLRATAAVHGLALEASDEGRPAGPEVEHLFVDCAPNPDSPIRARPWVAVNTTGSWEVTGPGLGPLLALGHVALGFLRLARLT